MIKKGNCVASFEQHLNVSVITTGLFIVPLSLSNTFDTQASLIALSLGLLGGIFPDLDSDNSKPIRILFKILSIFFPLLFLIFLQLKMPLLYILVVWLGATLLFHFGVFKFFTLITTHRGIFHSIPMALFIALGVIHTFLYLHYPQLQALLFGVFFFFGFIIHLLLDELFSINALGFEIKKSFGSALKLYDKENLIGTTLLYGGIGFLAYNLHLKQEIYHNFFALIQQLHFY